MEICKSYLTDEQGNRVLDVCNKLLYNIMTAKKHNLNRGH